MATSTGFPDLVTILVNLSQHIEPILSMMQTGAFLVGFYFIGHAMIEIWGVANEGGTMKFLKANQRYSYGSAFIQLLIGAIFVGLGDLEWMGIMSRTFTGDYVNSKFIAHSAESNEFAEQAKLATQALLGIMQMVGFIAMCKGWMTINRIFNAQTQDSIGKGLTWIVGGVLAWNFEWFVGLINNSLGFNIIQLFPT